MTRDRIVISSNLGQVTAELVDNADIRALVRMLPITIKVRDHLKLAMTGTLPSPLPELQRQTEFTAGSVALWGNDDFVIYYREGRATLPGIIVLGRVTGNVSIFVVPGPLEIRIQKAD